MQAQLAVCKPPTDEQVRHARAKLMDFAVIRVIAHGLLAEAATEPELDDLAYLQVALASSGAPVGLAGTDGSVCDKPNPEIVWREQRRAAWESAQHGTDSAQIAEASTRLLMTFGFPGPLCFEQGSSFGASDVLVSSALRELATANERLGRFADAQALYRRAHPFAGGCGTSFSSFWLRQVKGVIRTAELSGRCQDAVAERLLAVDGHEGRYGPMRLTNAGFDVSRIYRGALVTANRGLPLDVLARLFEGVSTQLGSNALTRLNTLGREDWDSRLMAVEGFADVEQRAALPKLVTLSHLAESSVRKRALTAIEQLAQRPYYDPCRLMNGRGGGSSSSVWRRPIRPLGKRCETRLSLPDAAALTDELLPLLHDPDSEVRAQAVRTIGAIAAPEGAAALRRELSAAQRHAGELSPELLRQALLRIQSFPRR